MFTMLPLKVGIECVLGVTAPTTPNGVYSSMMSAGAAQYS